MKEIFKVIITDFLEKEMPTIVEREIQIPLDSKKIITLVGARRTGKTFLFYSNIKKLRERINTNLIVYLNFEDDRLFPLLVKDLNLLVEAYYELFPKNRDKTVYFFFDEIQNVDNWEKFIRRIYDSLNCKIYITGSSSKFLSKEIATALRGRTISFEVFPFSFIEYINYKGIDHNYYSSKNKSEIINAADYYLHNSSFPELFETSAIEKPKVMKEYLDLIIYKDLIERYRINNIYLIKYLIKFLLTNSANPLSITKIYNDFKSQGIKVSKDSLFQYLGYLEDAYILFPVKIYSNNLREIQRNQQKIYAIDSGLIDTVSVKKDIGRRFENMIYLELRRKFQNISYFKLNQEVDFCVIDSNKTFLINASFQITDSETKKREIKSLLEGMNYFNIKESFLITNNYEEELKIEEKRINLIPFWKWILTS